MGLSRPYSGGFFQLSIDGEKTTVYLKTVDGASVSQEVMSERFGETQYAITHASVANIKDVTFEFGMAGASTALKWIKDSWTKKYDRRSGQIDHADFDGNIKYSDEFSNALIAETTFPALDGKSKDPAYMKVKFTPESVAPVAPQGKLDPIGGTKQKLWTSNCFRFKIDGIDGMEFTNKLESFTVKQAIKKMGIGERRYQEIMPTRVEFPQITGTIGESYAGSLREWANKYLHKGKRDPKAQRTGSLEFLAPNKEKVLFRVNMFNMSLKSLETAQAQANETDVKRLKFTLQIERMELDGQLGFD